MENEQELSAIGMRLGALLAGGESFELVGDVGAGKTTLVKAIAAGMGITDGIASPSYTLSQTYTAPSGLRLVHYDFYRLDDPGILAQELEEVLADNSSVVAIEWADIIADVLPFDHLQIQIVPISENGRRLVIAARGDRSARIAEQLV